MSESSTPARLGISGRLAAAFQKNPLTPILAIMGLLLGLLAVAITPREEEPQIDVTMANVIVPFDGASSRDVEQWVATPLEQKLSEIEGVKHVYSISRPGVAVLTVEFEVGVQRQPALVRLYNQVFSNQDWLPQGVGVGQPIVKPKGIDDVPVMAVTLWSDDPATDASRLAIDADFVLHRHDRHARAADRVHVLDALDLRELLFQRHGHELLDVARAGAIERHDDVGHGHVDLRLLLARRDRHREQAEQQTHDRQDRGQRIGLEGRRQPPGDAQARRREGLSHARLPPPCAARPTPAPPRPGRAPRDRPGATR